MKRFIRIIGIHLLIVILTACGGNQTKPAETKQSKVQQEQQTVDHELNHQLRRYKEMKQYEEKQWQQWMKEEKKRLEYRLSNKKQKESGQK